MKLNHLALSMMAAAGVFLVSACNDQSQANASADVKANAPAATAITAESDFNSKVAYSIGASVGTYIATVQKDQREIIGELNQDLVIKGFTDALQSKTSLTEEEIGDILMSLDTKVRESMQQKQQAEAQKNLDAGNAFLAENAKKAGVVVTKSGLQYELIKEGKGASPKADDTVSVTYKGTTIDGEIFDQQTDPISFNLGNIIPGWTEGLQLMKEGSEFKFYIPANLAYGEAGAGNVIKPNSVLIFEVKLIKVGADK